MDRLLLPSASLEIWENGYFIFMPLLFQGFPRLYNLCSREWQRRNYVITVFMLHLLIKAHFLWLVLFCAPSEHNILAKICLWAISSCKENLYFQKEVFAVFSVVRITNKSMFSHRFIFFLSKHHHVQCSWSHREILWILIWGCSSSLTVKTKSQLIA